MREFQDWIWVGIALAAGPRWFEAGDNRGGRAGRRLVQSSDKS